MLPLKKALVRGVITQKRIHHKPCAKAEAGDEGVQLGFAHELGVGVTEAEEKLTEQLVGENKELFLRFCNASAEFMGESELDTFITGFRFGARFMMDTFLSDDAPFESFLEG